MFQWEGLCATIHSGGKNSSCNQDTPPPHPTHAHKYIKEKKSHDQQKYHQIFNKQLEMTLQWFLVQESDCVKVKVFGSLSSLAVHLTHACTCYDICTTTPQYNHVHAYALQPHHSITMYMHMPYNHTHAHVMIHVHHATVQPRTSTCHDTCTSTPQYNHIHAQSMIHTTT